MRLRLSIQRHALPPAEVLWNVSEEQALKLFSIAQLLEEINHIIPLESEDWGLEDYVVEVGGFECFHFAQVAQVLKDEDRICIRALQTSEIRARTLSGRYQISENGQHLIDGIPFGRPYLRQPNRPAIRIPPRKRRRITYGEEEYGEGCEETTSSILIPQHWKVPLNNLEDDSEDDEDFSPYSQINSIQDPTTSNRKKVVRFNSQPSTKELTTSPLEDDDDSEEYDPHWDLESSEASSDEESEAESDSSAPEGDSDSDSDSKGASHNSEADSSSDSSSDSDTSSEESDQSEPEELSSKPVSSKQKITIRQNSSSHDASPYREGKKATQERNRRRRDIRKIRRLQMVGVLPATANRNDLHDFESNQTLADTASLSTEVTQEPLSKSKPALPQSRAAVNMTGKTNGITQDLELGRQQLLAAIEAGGIDVTSDHSGKKSNKETLKKTEGKEASLELKSGIVESEGKEAPTGSSTVLSGYENEGLYNDLASEPQYEPPQKRARIDLAGSRRLLFGSLGVRTPKTKAEEEKLKAKLMVTRKSQGKAKPGTQPGESQPPEDIEMTGLEDLNAWKTRINLTAFECWDNHIQLSTPPFPFQQRWDPQQKQHKGRKNKKQKRMDAKYYEEEETYEEGVCDVFLNYDEEEDSAAPTSDRADVDTAIQSQLQLDIEDVAARMEPIDDLPPLPADLSTLSILKEGDIKRGNIIVFKQLECSLATNWAPVISPFRTAIIEELTEIETFGLRLAKRDQPHEHVRYDENGKRIYEKFEMEYLSEDEDKPGVDGLVYLAFEDLVEPKLLQISAEPVEQYDAVADAEDIGAEAHEEVTNLEGQTNGVSPCSLHATDNRPSVQECHMRLDESGKDEIETLMNGKNSMEQSALVETSA